VIVGGDVGGERAGPFAADLRPAVGNEDQTGGETQDQRRDVRGELPHATSGLGAVRRKAIALDRYVGPLLLFLCFYVATLFLFRWLAFQLAGLIAVTVATTLTITIWDRGQWPLGLFVPPRNAARELAIGIAWGALLIIAGSLLITLSTDVRHGPGRGFPWRELITLFIPAALHEELLFRGYVFQKLLRGNRPFAYLFVAFIFALLHAGNRGVTLLALTNVFLGGILLGLAYERYGHLWFPIGLHLAWNLTSGPILGDEVSGFTGEASVFIERGGGAWWMTGGRFGMEGSVWMTLVELLGIVLLWRKVRGAR